MTITDPAVLDLLPGDTIVFVGVRHNPDYYRTKVFHLWARDCRSVSAPTERTTIAEARARGLGLCESCTARAQSRAGRDQDRERKAGT